MSRPVARWTGLLVSVRDAVEAVDAVAGGAAIVDVKEPLNGPLGAASARVAAAVAAAVGGRVPWTLACGELARGADAAAVVHRALAALPGGVDRPAAAKAGPAGLAATAWRSAFAIFASALPPDVEAIAVAYADWRKAAAPAPCDLVAAAADAGCRTLLIDTFDKSATGTAAGADLPASIAAARAAGMAVAVAGRLERADVPGVIAFGADVVAVRSAACRGGRLGRVDRALVAALAAAIPGPGKDGGPVPATLDQVFVPTVPERPER